MRFLPVRCFDIPCWSMQVDWDKGHALLHLLAAMGLDVDDDVLPIYIGDDRTDEDAFRALRSRAKGGLGILVSSKVAPTCLLCLNPFPLVLSYMPRGLGLHRSLPARPLEGHWACFYRSLLMCRFSP